MVKRIERTTSRTAAWTCVSRAVSSLEQDPYYRGDDRIALELVPRFLQVLLRSALMRRLFSRKVAPAGIYEYVIARTRYIDDAYRRALADDFEQILIFGAGFDTRALRFQPNSKETRVFELDVPITQQAKIEQYRKRGLEVPANLTFIAIDFDKESLPDKLDQAGFQKKKRSLFILEGVLMYLKPKSVQDTFKVIRKYSGEQSRVVFDTIYDSVLRRENRYYGEEGIYRNVADADERWQFGIEEGKIDDFLSQQGFRLLDQRNATELETLYFTDTHGERIARVNGTHCLVTAEIT